MKKLTFFKIVYLFLPLITLLLIFPSLTFSICSQTQERAGEVRLKQVEPFVYFSLKQKGSLENIDTLINQLIETARSQNVYPTGPLLTIFHGDLANIDPEKVEWEFGFPVTSHALVQAPLERKIWEFSPVAACIHVGPYEKMTETIKKMLDWMEANGYAQAGPLLERSIEDDPTKIKPDYIRVEIWIPCKKKD